MQVKSWSNMNRTGDWVLEKRVSKDGTRTSYHLCCMDGKEEGFQCPQDLVDVLIKGGAVVAESSGWE